MTGDELIEAMLDAYFDTTAALDVVLANLPSRDEIAAVIHAVHCLIKPPCSPNNVICSHLIFEIDDLAATAVLALLRERLT